MEAMQPAPEMRKLQPMVAPQHRRYTEPHKRHGKLNHSLSDSALMLDPCAARTESGCLLLPRPSLRVLTANPAGRAGGETA